MKEAQGQAWVDDTIRKTAEENQMLEAKLKADAEVRKRTEADARKAAEKKGTADAMRMTEAARTVDTENKQLGSPTAKAKDKAAAKANPENVVFALLALVDEYGGAFPGDKMP